MEHHVDERDEKVAVVGRAEHRFEPGVAEKVHINLGVKVAEFVFGEVDAEIVRAVFEETEEVFDVVAGTVALLVALVVGALIEPMAEPVIALMFTLLPELSAVLAAPEYSGGRGGNFFIIFIKNYMLLFRVVTSFPPGNHHG